MSLTESSNRPAAKLSSDLLWGADAIADELGIDVRRAYYLLENKLIPGTKTGRSWSSSRRKLREHFETT